MDVRLISSVFHHPIVDGATVIGAHLPSTFGRSRSHLGACIKICSNSSYRLIHELFPLDDLCETAVMNY